MSKIPKAYIDAPAGTKRCSKCHEFVPLTEFNKHSKAKDGLNHLCRACSTKVTAECNRRNMDLGKKLGVRHLLAGYIRARDAGKLRPGTVGIAWVAAWIAGEETFTNPKTGRHHWVSSGHDVAKSRERSHQHYADNPGQYSARNALREAAKIQATPAWLTKEDRALMAQLEKGRGLLSKLTPEPMHLDHIVPLRGARHEAFDEVPAGCRAVCGLHVPDNLIPMRSSTNLTKSGRFTDNWAREIEATMMSELRDKGLSHGMPQ